MQGETQTGGNPGAASGHTWATLHRLTPERITEPQVRSLVHVVRRELRLTKRRALQGRDAALLALVEQRVGRRRDESHADYWQRVQRAWNAMPESGSDIGSPWTTQRAYERVSLRVSGRDGRAQPTAL